MRGVGRGEAKVPRRPGKTGCRSSSSSSTEAHKRPLLISLPLPFLASFTRLHQAGRRTTAILYKYSQLYCFHSPARAGRPVPRTLRLLDLTRRVPKGENQAAIARWRDARAYAPLPGTIFNARAIKLAPTNPGVTISLRPTPEIIMADPRYSMA